MATFIDPYDDGQTANTTMTTNFTTPSELSRSLFPAETTGRQNIINEEDGLWEINQFGLVSGTTYTTEYSGFGGGAIDLSNTGGFSVTVAGYGYVVYTLRLSLWVGGVYVLQNSVSVNDVGVYDLMYSSPVGDLGSIAKFKIDVITNAGAMGTTLGIVQTIAAICVAGETLIETPLKSTPIKDIKTDDQVIGVNGNPVKVKYNIACGRLSKYIKIAKDALGNNQPNQDLYITHGHPLLINGQEIECQDLVNDTTITHVFGEPKELYSLCTEERLYVMMNNVPVCTWSEKEWDVFRAKRPDVKWIKH